MVPHCYDLNNGWVGQLVHAGPHSDDFLMNQFSHKYHGVMKYEIAIDVSAMKLNTQAKD